MRLLPAVDAPPHPQGYRDETTPDLLRSFYRDMVLSRRLDAELGALQRQGQLALWVSLAGQEAAQVGSAHALDEVDTVFPSYREHGVAWVRGVDPLHLASLFRGADFGGWDPAAHRFQLYTLVLATQTLHAVGFARAVMIEQRAELVPAAGSAGAEAVVVYLGDGAASEGDASEALSWAAVDNVPLVFFCQNNQWAISTPSARQARVPLARRAEGFGMPGVRVDGNDVVAVHSVTSAALRRARRGGGPTFVEAVTYRMNGHSTADDPSRYRDAEEVDRWRARDPIERLRRRLDADGLADDAYLTELQATAEALASRLRSEVPAMPEPPPGDLARFVFAEPSPARADGHPCQRPNPGRPARNRPSEGD